MNLKRLFNILSRPHLIPIKIVRRIQNLFINLNYEYEKYEKEQVERFNVLGLDYIDSKTELEKLYAENPDLNVEMASCHHNLFVAFSSQKKFENILEIGTHSGAGAVLLSTIFPQSKIETIDLPDNHPIFLTTYLRKDKTIREKFLNDRNKLLEDRKNINFKQMNSLELSFVTEKKYDFIWIDGAHGYPVVAIDIVNCLRLLRPGGVIACDDVYTSIKKSDGMYASIASYETIQSLSEANLVDFSLILKRTIVPHAHPKFRKYVAVVSHKKR